MTEDEFLYEDDLHDATLELDDSDDYTADIEMVDGTHALLFPSEDESELEDDMPDKTFGRQMIKVIKDFEGTCACSVNFGGWAYTRGIAFCTNF